MDCNSNLLVIIFVIKLLSKNHLFTYIKEKYGEPTRRQCRSFERALMRYEKLKCDLDFLKTCKNEKLIPTFAKPKISIDADFKIRRDIAAIIIRAEIRNKHRIKNSIKEQLRNESKVLQDKTSFATFNALRYKLRNWVRNRRNKWKETHMKKLDSLRTGRTRNIQNSKRISKTFSRIIVNNFSSYVLSEREAQLLALSFDHYVPFNTPGKKVQVEFERFFQNLTPHTSHLTENEKISLKRKFLGTFQQFEKVHLKNNDQEVISRLTKNKDLVFLKQDKGRGVVILDRNTYVDKCSEFLQGRQFERLEEDPTQTFQAKVQRTLLSMKKSFDQKTYERLYPSASHPGQFFGLGKVHKLEKSNWNVQALPLRPVISNIGTATYEISKYLSKMIAPLAKGNYTIESTKDFINKLKGRSFPVGHSMVSFDVKNLFTNVPLDFTIDHILKQVYDEKILGCKLKRGDLKRLLQLCTKEMHFSFNDVIYKQVDGVAMGSPLGPVIANVFMVALENDLVPKISEKIGLWQRFVDDTFTFIKEKEVENVKSILNSFHEDIQFTHEIEKHCNIAFLDVSVTRKRDGTFLTSVHRKSTDTNIYMNWNSFAPRSWKIGTLKGLFRRAFLICSNKRALDSEIMHLKSVFTGINGYPSKIVHNTLNQIIKTLERESNLQCENTVTSAQANSETKEEYFPHMCLPYKGKQGEGILNDFKSTVKKFLPKNVTPRIVYQGKKLGSFFKIKDKIKTEHQSDLVYGYANNLSGGNKHKEKGDLEYVGETGVRYGTRIHEHYFTDRKSAIFKYRQDNDLEALESNFEVLESGYSNKTSRKLAEALYIKALEPKLNEQVKSYKLNLFN